MNSYDLSRKWFDYSFENTGVIKPVHTSIYFFAIEHCNRLGWKENFGFPTTMVMEALSIKSYNTYSKALNEIVDLGFLKMVEKSKNQFSSNIIALSNFDKATNKALDKALIKHTSKQSESTIQSISQSIDSINKQINKKQETINKETRNQLKDFHKSLGNYLKDVDVSKKQDLEKLLLKDVDDSQFTENQKLHFEIAKAFQQLFIKNLEEKNGPTTTQENAKYKGYVTPIRLMMEKDNITKEQITKVFKYLQSPEGSFWKSNILSTSKLREKFQQLILQSQNKSNNGKQQSSTSQGGASDEFRRKTAERLGFVQPK